MAMNAKKDFLKFWGIHIVPETPTKVPETQTKAASPVTAPVHAKTIPASAVTASRPSENLKPGEKQVRLETLRQEILQRCPKCGLEKTRTHLVFGEGNVSPDIVFVGEAPGFDEDKTGRPFVGKAGQLLTDIITKGMGLTREKVYICNILKCRPPENRVPTPDEVAACSRYLVEQLRILHPRVIVALGASAVRGLLPDLHDGISRLRGRFYDYYYDGPGTKTGEAVPVMATFHPSYLLRNPAAKKYVWEDIKKVLTFLDIPIPTTKKST
jgi:DNA polymerase